jgi:hypothetical protein
LDEKSPICGVASGQFCVQTPFFRIVTSNSKFDSVGHLALNLARALARNNTSSKSMIKSKSKTKASRKDNTLLNLELLDNNKKTLQ